MSVCAASAAARVNGEFDEDSRIRTRLEACRMGMQQLEALRSKHTKLMQDIRSYYPSAGVDEVKVVARVKKPRENPLVSPLPRTNVNVAPFISSERYEDLLRCESPVSQCYSHRSSVSIDSGCASITSDQLNSSTASFSTLRKASIDESASVIEVEVDSQSRNGQNNNSMTHMIATAIASTTAVRPARRYVKNWQRERPRSMYASVPDTEAPSYLDHHSFSQITPPPIHKKFATVSRTESFHQSPLPRHSMTNLATVEDIPSPVPSHLSIQKLSVPCPVSRVSPMPKSPEIQPKIFPQVARKPLVPHPIVSQASITVNGQKPIAVSSPRPLPRTIPQPPPRTSLKLQSPSLYHTARVYVQQQRPLVKARETVPTTFIAHPALVVSRSQSSGSSTDSSPVPIRRTYVVQPIRRTDPSPKPEKKWFESESL